MSCDKHCWLSWCFNLLHDSIWMVATYRSRLPTFFVSDHLKSEATKASILRVYHGHFKMFVRHFNNLVRQVFVAPRELTQFWSTSIAFRSFLWGNCLICLICSYWSDCKQMYISTRIKNVHNFSYNLVYVFQRVLLNYFIPLADLVSRHGF